jgi:phosphatidylserine/phosphatidylglycerophosphate/cardiolipin synthase-like enzyme
MFVGSENFSITSLTKNRELGLTTTSPTLIGQMEPVLVGDFNGAGATS